MLKTTLIRYTEYNYWANNLLISLIKNKVDDATLDKEIISSFPSLRKTIYHIWDAEYIWNKRLNGESLTDWPSKIFSGTFSEAGEQILSNNKNIISSIEKLKDEQLSSPFSYKNIEGKIFSNGVWEAVMHCMNHSTYHRGQVVTLLRQLGIAEIPATDFIAFCRVIK